VWKALFVCCLAITQAAVWLKAAAGSIKFMRIASKQPSEEDPELVLLVATADGSFRPVHARTGDMMSAKWTAPKAKEPLVACFALASDGTPAQVSS
jgi:hypothetical protein